MTQLTAIVVVVGLLLATAIALAGLAVVLVVFGGEPDDWDER